MRPGLPGKPRAHIADSAAFLREPLSHHDLIRPGITLYRLLPLRRSSGAGAFSPAAGDGFKTGFCRSRGASDIPGSATVISSEPSGPPGWRCAGRLRRWLFATADREGPGAHRWTAGAGGWPDLHEPLHGRYHGAWMEFGRATRSCCSGGRAPGRLPPMSWPPGRRPSVTRCSVCSVRAISAFIWRSGSRWRRFGASTSSVRIRSYDQETSQGKT